MTVLHVTPCFAMDNIANGLRIDAKPKCHLPHRHQLHKPSYFNNICGSELRHFTSSGVLARIYYLKMIRVHTGRISTQMVKMLAIRNRSPELLPDNTMRVFNLAPKRIQSLSIAVLLCVSLPNPTSCFSVNDICRRQQSRIMTGAKSAPLSSDQTSGLVVFTYLCRRFAATTLTQPWRNWIHWTISLHSSKYTRPDEEERQRDEAERKRDEERWLSDSAPIRSGRERPPERG